MRISEYRGFQYITALISRYLEAAPQSRSIKVFHYPVDVRMQNRGEAGGAWIHNPDVAIYFLENLPDLPEQDDGVVDGVPDLMIEIQSPGCGSRDLNKNMALYERAGIKEHWLIHPLDRIILCRRLHMEGKFERPLVYSEADMIPVHILPGLTLDLYPIFNPSLPDRLIKNGRV